MRSLSVESPAKLNLSLRVLRKRKDGYHELYTLFHRISLRDTLQLSKRKEGIRLYCSHPKVPKRGNLIVEAFRLLKRQFPFQGGVTVRLTKRIPVGGGLGGGSSNAAHFLLGMNRLYRLGLSQKKLLTLGAKLGSDVPFFLSDHRYAVGTGRGEKLQGLSLRRKLWFLLICSPKGLSTRKVYQGLRLERRWTSLTRVRHDVKITSAFLQRGKFRQATQFLKNDLQASAERIRPSLMKARESLSALQLGRCQMSGSGPTLFFIFLSKRKTQQALSKVRNHLLSKSSSLALCHSF
ncbi:MAG: 4-(cytidine 5'-diphospho)-2-C-methyl-D-erythritol kinase [Candidatus Omnitrophica bacterium]|nr:4-(cytidine 5'-diphospho)-2-C-methyl-D-erythritol kinase [Candidatus Omnitrophota bacterium]